MRRQEIARNDIPRAIRRWSHRHRDAQPSLIGARLDLGHVRFLPALKALDDQYVTAWACILRFDCRPVSPLLSTFRYDCVGLNSVP